MLVFAFSIPAFAVGEELIHEGYSTSGYYTTQSVPQMSDRHLNCLSYETTGDIKVYACFYNGSQYIAISDTAILITKPTLTLSTSGSVRNVKLRVFNYGDSSGVRTYSRGHWKLNA